ncbi:MULTISPECIES: enoyl-CoA hydratase-related protein [unclassified Variovorax]|jgi:enoyl-CoA hydratase|uniref:enoyl-CoA hydratase/isomerase family protein n=1 Tax=unclassified Variovorax TaxID=663243 RepID=UPI00086E1199|nr:MULTISPECIES: enoyl-CoA hydratase-related protein [unclassified Variovorax]MBN8754597.1 enoyl-CoA hydratase/isomerase family protein [Variovorax sp.]ODU19322.1 MAG: 3-hydroxybutyryl-CoA dehydratase [Variovorax sp. SCN 67-85]ODV25367.1 MAG: 3-hydroxybutyryl-CoA dehydratase [Variovorax sp. SCN 67-20]OJZ03043.1 MAG: 3-hydroxybutyryl-CoA dehydratase [Variovorax sp. 67-131]
MSTPQLHLAGHVATITLQRPDQANRLTPDDLTVLLEHIAEINAKPEVLVLQLRAGGKYFCSGYDITSIGGPRPVDFEALVNSLEEARPVTIALLHGSVYGGATDLALACDFRIGVPGIDMFMPAARLGLHFYRRGLERYVSRLGVDNAKRLFLTAQKIGAEEMKVIGFLTHLVEGGAIEEAAEQLTNTCAAMAPIAMLGMKRHLNRIARGALDLGELQEDMKRAFASKDLREGQAAWAEKRAPHFTGR